MSSLKFVIGGQLLHIVHVIVFVENPHDFGVVTEDINQFFESNLSDYFFRDHPEIRLKPGEIH